MNQTPVIVAHGGAGSYTTVFDNPEERAIILNGVKEAASAGYRVLQDGGTAVDAVQAAVMYMEDSPLFNAGYGSYLTKDYTVQMDASIMDGTTLKAGAVAGITNVKNPVCVARRVMDKTSHTLLCGEAAKLFAEREGFDIVSTESLITAKAVKRLESVPGFTPSVSKEFYEKIANLKVKDPLESAPSVSSDVHDTVGAVAVDGSGNVAYATSTGGISGQMQGRVGDSPIVGSGGYADNKSGAVSTTGHGEALMKMCAAKHAAMLMESGKSPQEAIKKAMDLTQERVGGSGGCIAVNQDGDIGIYMTSEGMAWASIKDKAIQSGIYKNDVTESVFSG